MEPVSILRGQDVVLRLLAEQTFDVRAVDLAGFREWLGRLLARWQRDPVFLRRAAIRDLRRANPRLRELEETHRRAVAADAASPQFPRLRELERELADARKAVAGLIGALAGAPPVKAEALGAKLAGFRTTVVALQAERAELERTSAERQALLRAVAEWEAFRTAIGLDREEARLAELLTERGRRSGRSGESFEELAAGIAERHIVPELAVGGPVRLLRGVRLGAADVEFDLLAVRPGDPVEVLAAVEAKRNVNDLAAGFLHRQADLAWLTGDAAAYDPAARRTRHFPSGHFDRPAVHRERGEAFRFAPGSFAPFRRDPAIGYFLDRLYLVTRPGPVWGLRGAAVGRVGHHLSTDEELNRADPAHLARLLAWCRSLAGPAETPDVLRLFAADEARAARLLFAVPPAPEAASTVD